MRPAVLGLFLATVLVGCRAEAPSAFQVTILPPQPVPSDLLSAVRLEESILPSAGAVEYEYRWYVDGEARDDLVGEFVPAAETSAGQSWRVTVFAIADGVEGPPAVAEVVVGDFVLPDQDGDGFDSGEDCDDTDELVNPDAEEECDGDDENCNDLIDEGFDQDDDGITSCGGDCDDTDGDVFPGAEELCNGIDDDCQNGPDFDGSGEVDEDEDGFLSCLDCDDEDATLVPSDADGDGFSPCDGDCDDTDADINPVDGDGDGLSVCAGDCDDSDDTLNQDDADNDGASTCDGDCNDTVPTVGPNATELCNGVDDDCDGDDDEGFDADGDGFTACGSDGIEGTLDDDCDDTDASITPTDGDGDGFSVCADDCDDADPLVGPFDSDGDGTTGCDGDCDDGDASILPLATEVCDAVDQDCDGAVDEGFDGDGDGFTSCGVDGLPDTADDDCDDSDDSIQPGATELCDGIDSDCDPATFPLGGEDDLDGDGVLGCADCDDTDADTYPGAPETCDGVADNNCDGLPIPEDTDVDGDDWSPCQGDCDDTDPTRHPEAVEVGDSIDQDCDGVVDEGTDVFDDDGDGLTEQDGDCNDDSADVFPGAPETCDGFPDNNCDLSLDPTDLDADGDGASECQGDCDDFEPASFPGNPEVCDDGLDNDCDGIDQDCADVDGDLDGFSPNQGDCDDLDASIYPGAPDTPPDGIDQDCDGDPDGPDTWSQLSLAGDPLPPLTGAAAVWDPINERLLIVGGRTYNDLLGVTFSLDPTTNTVTELVPVGDSPAPRFGHKVAVDSPRGRLLLVGGRGAYDVYDDVWSFDLITEEWTELAPTGDLLEPRLGHSLHFDSDGDQLVLFGGQGYGAMYDDVWTLSFANSVDGEWERMIPTGPAPSPRMAHGAAWDDVNRRLFVGGGRAYSDVPSDLYLWHASVGPAGTWTSLDPTQGAPDGGAAPSWVWDPIALRLLAVGGRVPNDLLLELQTVSFLDGLPGDWFGLSPAGPAPGEFTAACVVFDPDGYGLWGLGGTTWHGLIEGAWRLDF